MERRRVRGDTDRGKGERRRHCEGGGREDGDVKQSGG